MSEEAANCTQLNIFRENYTDTFWFKERYPSIPESGFLSMAGHNEPNSGGQFHFISVQNADDRTARRLARSHAVARGLENKRKLQRKSGLNFHVVSEDDLGRHAGKRKQDRALVMAPSSPSAGAPGPFQMLAAESPRLQALFSHCMIFAGAQSTWWSLPEMIQIRPSMLQSPSLAFQMNWFSRTFAQFFEKG